MTKESQESFLPGQEKAQGLTVFKGWMFIVGEMAGIGALMYPAKIFDLTFSFLALVFVGCIALYSALKLSQTWVTLDKDPKYETKNCKEPYPLMTEAAFGAKGKQLSRFCVMTTLVFIACIYIIMTSQNLSKLFGDLVGLELCTCQWMIILVITLTPCTWLPTPKDQWLIAVMAASTTIIAFILIAIQAFMDGQSENVELISGFDQKLHEFHENITYKAHTDIPAFGYASFGQFINMIVVFIFGFGGMSIFPTIQTDMKRASDFNQVVIFSISSLIFLYAIVMLPGYMNYGSIADNIMMSLSDSWIAKIANFLMTLHMITALVILTNPPMQQIELLVTQAGDKQDRKLNSFQQKILRTIYMLSLLVFCQTVPSFTPIAEFIGATTVVTNSFFLPSFIYLKIVYQVNFWELKQVWYKVPKFDILVIMTVVVMGSFGGIYKLNNLFMGLAQGGGNFVSPCWYDQAAACAALEGSSSSH